MTHANCLLLVSSFLLCACAGFGPGKEPAPIFTYDCGDFGTATFQMTGSESAELVVGVTRYPMQRQRAASGAKFAGPDVEFWSRGSEAMLVVGLENGTCQRSDTG